MVKRAIPGDGPVFPLLDKRVQQPMGGADGIRPMESYCFGDTGLTKREHIAIAAMAALVQTERFSEFDLVKKAYRIADLMLAEGQK